MEGLVNHLGGLASLIGSLTVVGSALMWIYNKFIAQPREERRQKEEGERQEKMLEIISQENKPLLQSINRLSEVLDESVKDRENLNKIAEKNSGQLKKHKEIIDDHGERLIVLESKTGLRYSRGGE